ncbi:MAG TPA: hypothetical protein VMF68_08115 [Spirochaetia bacterium]|nr:hypothetical protein [Spirochaetia bacterium]
MDIDEQQRLGAEIASQAVALARASTDLQFDREPGLRERFGERGVAKSYEDALHTMRFLAESVSLGSAATFAGYARWLDDVLLAAHVPPGVLPEHFRILKEVILLRLSPPAASQASAALDEALAVLAEKRSST